MPDQVMSHPSRGAWIEIGADAVLSTLPPESHPSRGAWIEIRMVRLSDWISSGSHPSRGAWIEIDSSSFWSSDESSRTPHGVRGLK